jgi:flagellar biosynthesis protein FlhB
VSEAKTEEPTARREHRARREGRVWQSRDLTLGATLVAASALLRLGTSSTTGAIEALFARSLAGDTTPSEALVAAMSDGARVAIPLLVGIVLVASVASALQVRGLLAFAAVAPDPARLGPSAWDGPSLASFALGLVRVAVVLAVSVATLIEGMPGIATLARRPPHSALAATTTMASALTLRVGIAMLAIGVLDAILERVRFRASLRMSRREVERERREAEGDEHVRRERDRIREELWRSSSVDALADAVLIVIGEALAIALAHDATDPDAVPIVVVLERDALAEAMEREARARGTPIAHEDELASQLAIVPLAHPIPEALYERVAAAIAGIER